MIKRKIYYKRIIYVCIMILIPAWGLVENNLCSFYETSCKLHSAKNNSINSVEYNSLILGGSNVVYGLLTSNISIQPYVFYNAGLNYEGGNFDNYLSFLERINNKENIKIIIYSTFDLLKKNINVIDAIDIVGRKNIILPNISVKNFIKYGALEFKIDKYGNVDKDFYNQCLLKSYRSTDDLDFSANPNTATKEKFEILSQRLDLLKVKFPNAKIFFLLPPIYIHEEKTSVLYYNVENNLKNRFKDVRVISPSIEILMSNKYFCDESHLNDAGRLFFSNYLSDKLL